MVKGSPPKTFPSLSSTLLIRNQRKTAPARQISSCVSICYWFSACPSTPKQISMPRPP